MGMIHMLAAGGGGGRSFTTEQKRGMIKNLLRRRRQILRLPPGEETEQIIDEITTNIMNAIGQSPDFELKIQMTLDPEPYIDQHPAKIGLTHQQKEQQARPSSYSETLNSFVSKLGLVKTVDFLSKTIYDIMEYDPSVKTMISVGSGNGILEYILERKMGPSLRIICIDPDPQSFLENSKVYKEPEYSTIHDYLRAEGGGSAQDYILFLNWPSPAGYEGGSGYDAEAIYRLKPHFVICLIALDNKEHGAAGSHQFHQIRNTDKSYDKKVITTFTQRRGAGFMSIITYVMELWTLKTYRQQLQRRRQLLRDLSVVTMPFSAQQTQAVKRQLQHQLLSAGIIPSSRQHRPHLFN